MSEIKVNKVSPRSGTTVTLGDSGDTFTVPSGVTLDTSNSTVTLPDGSVTNAKLANSSISINGSSVSLGGSTTIETGTSWQSTIVTGSTLTAVAGNGYWIDTTSNACTVTLPASASVGDTIEFVDYARTWGTNAVTLNTNSLNFQGATTSGTGDYPIYNTNGQSIRIIYSGSTQGWIPSVDDDVTYETEPFYAVDFLVVAGGGGGHPGTGGGGGAGGYRSSYNNESSGGGASAETFLGLYPSQTYTITVGAGGAADYAGSDSSISGYGITTITSVGGGKGGGGAGGAGGSGGGGGYNNAAGGSGTANQGYDGGTNTSGSSEICGGGGGAGQVGQPNNGSTSGAGGYGVDSTITGSTVKRGGGGAGGCWQSGGGTPGTGGAGGGGNGGRYADINATAGTANTGGGGGGGLGAAGGSGVVILRMATSNYTGTYTGTPSVSTSGSDTILVFNASGSYTA